MSEPIFRHPERPVPKFRPFRAMHHFRKLIADKEDTEQVFHIFQCLPRLKLVDEIRAFVYSDFGRQLRMTEPYLPDILDDHARLRAMPKGSVAHAYVDFMEREGLSAAGLVAEYDRFQGNRRYGDMVEWYVNRLRDTHDLLHVLTGYGRDALGEASVLAWRGRPQTRSFGQPTAGVSTSNVVQTLADGSRLLLTTTGKVEPPCTI